MNSASPSIAILPLGAYEYHGPHLPYETDTLIAEGLCEQLKQRLPAHLKVKFLPIEPIGYSIEHQAHIKTRSLSYEKAIQKWIQIGEYCHKNNINKLLYLNAHGGNSPLLTIAATELRARFNMLVVVTSWTKFGFPPVLLNQKGLNYDIHAGLLETSLMLALKPELVSMALAENFSNKQKFFLKRYHYLRAYGGSNFGWMMQDLNAKGACGDATQASAQLGTILLDHVIENMILLLEDIYQFDQKTFLRK